MSSHSHSGGVQAARVDHHHDHGRHHGHGVRRQVLSAASEALGMERREVRDALRSGKTLADLAADKGLSTDELKTKMTEAVNASAPPKLAERIVARLDDIIAGNRVDGRGHGHHGHGHGGDGGVKEALQTFADGLGMTVKELVMALKAGTSMKDLIAGATPPEGEPAPEAPTEPGAVVDAAA